MKKCNDNILSYSFLVTELMPDMLAGHWRAVGEEFDGVGGRELRVRQDRTSGLYHRLPLQVWLISSFVSTYFLRFYA
jgi:hypothetical protein